MTTRMCRSGRHEMTPDNTGRRAGSGAVYCRTCCSEGSSQARVRVQTGVSWKWQDDAACRGADLGLFFGPDAERAPKKAVREAKAKTICGGCPVVDACLDYAVKHRQKGVWGGLNEDERAASRRQGAAA